MIYKLTTIIAATLMLVAVVYAQTAPKGNEGIKISVLQEAQLFAAIQTLDGLPSAVKDGGSTRVINQPYKLKAVVRLALARDLVLLQSQLNAVSKAKEAVFMQFSPEGKEITPGSQSFHSYQTEIAKIDESVELLPLVTITSDDLDLDENTGISGSTIAALQPIIASK